MKTSLACLLLWGCSYPEFVFVEETSVVRQDVADEVETAAPLEDSGSIPETEVAIDTCACSPTERCVEGACHPYPSCAALHAAAPALPTDVYTLDPDGPGPIARFSTSCEMKEDGGGWTLALKLDGAKKTFAFDAALWTNDLTLNPTSTAIDTEEAKLASFFTMPIEEVRVGMMIDGMTRRFLQLPVKSKTMRALFEGPPVRTTVGRARWLELLPNARLQTHCDAEGFNHDFTSTVSFGARARIGIFGNNEMDCASPDSYIAFGAGFSAPHACVGPEPGIVVGNFNPASCGNTPTDLRTIAAFGYVFLR